MCGSIFGIRAKRLHSLISVSVIQPSNENIRKGQSSLKWFILMQRRGCIMHVSSCVFTKKGDHNRREWWWSSPEWHCVWLSVALFAGIDLHSRQLRNERKSRLIFYVAKKRVCVSFFTEYSNIKKCMYSSIQWIKIVNEDTFCFTSLTINQKLNKDMIIEMIV